MGVNYEEWPMVTPVDYTPGPPQGQWTYKTYAAMPYEGFGYEVIKGVLYKSPTPVLLYHTVRNNLFFSLRTYLNELNNGEIYFAPLDVELAPDTVVQPDIVLLLGSSSAKITPSHIVGPPDLTVEVTEPNTVNYDRRVKQDAYAEGGVPELWFADPWSETIELMSLEQGAYRSLGVFQGKALLPSKIVPNLPVTVAQFFD